VSRSTYLSVLMTALAALMWASSFSVVKVGLRYIDPYTFVLLRFLVASVILLALVILRGRLAELRGCLGDGYVILLGVTLAASFGLQFRGQTETTAAKAAMIINSSVVLVAPLSVVFLREHIGGRKLLALGIGLVGVYLVTATRGADAGQAGTLAGDLLIAGSSVCYGLYVVFTRMAVTRRSFGEVTLIAGVFIWALPVFLLASVPVLRHGLSIDPRAWLPVFYLAVFCSVLPFVLYTAAMKHIGALTSAIVLLAELVFGVLFAYVFLGEVLVRNIVIGCVLICLGILIVGTSGTRLRRARRECPRRRHPPDGATGLPGSDTRARVV
jgi:drug/metabolite transporter (DMT)-like permease